MLSLDASSPSFRWTPLPPLPFLCLVPYRWGLSLSLCRSMQHALVTHSRLGPVAAVSRTCWSRGLPAHASLLDISALHTHTSYLTPSLSRLSVPPPLPALPAPSPLTSAPPTHPHTHPTRARSRARSRKRIRVVPDLLPHGVVEPLAVAQDLERVELEAVPCSFVRAGWGGAGRGGGEGAGREGLEGKVGGEGRRGKVEARVGEEGWRGG